MAESDLLFFIGYGIGSLALGYGVGLLMAATKRALEII